MKSVISIVVPSDQTCVQNVFSEAAMKPQLSLLTLQYHYTELRKQNNMNAYNC